MGASGIDAWSYAWNTKLYSNGQHTVEARSFDGKDFSQVASLTLTANNPAEQGPGGGQGSSDALGIALFIALLVLSVLLFFLFLRKKQPKKALVKHPESPQKEEIAEKETEWDRQEEWEEEDDLPEESP